MTSLLQLGEGSLVERGGAIMLEVAGDSAGPVGLPGVCAVRTELRSEDAHWVAGVLPDGAVDVRVDGAVTRVGRHLWIARSEAVRDPWESGLWPVYLDDTAGVVRLPDSPGSTSEAIADADGSCPACEGTSWSAVTAALPDDEHAVWIACDTCGTRIGGFVRSSRGFDEEWEELTGPLDDAEDPEILAAAVFPIYAPEGLEVEMAGWGYGDARVTSIVVRHEPDDARRLLVESHAPDPDEAPATQAEAQSAASRRLRFHTMPDTDRGIGRSDHARQLEFQLGAVAHARAFAAKPPVQGRRQLRVDGVQRPFTVAARDGDWVALGTVDGVGVTVVSRSVPMETVHLRGLAEPGQIADEASPVTYRPLREERG